MARPTLPRIRRGRARGIAGEIVERAEPRFAELSTNGLTWIHVDEPGPVEAAGLAERFGFHELDVEDVLSKRQRPKIDEYPDYLFIVLHFPFYDKTVQRLNAAELDVFLGQDFLITLPNVELLPVTYLFRSRAARRRSSETSPTRSRRSSRTARSSSRSVRLFAASSAIRSGSCLRTSSCTSTTSSMRPSGSGTSWTTTRR
jgi:hypothetical protein